MRREKTEETLHLQRRLKAIGALTEKRIYGPDYKVVVNEKNEVVWGCGKVPWDVYTPCKDLVYYNTGNNNYIFTNENIVVGRDDLISFTKHKDWFLAAYRQGVLYTTYWKKCNS